MAIEGGNSGHEIKRVQYLELVNDFNWLTSMNAMKLEQQVLPGHDSELAELRATLRKDLFTVEGVGYNYSDFTAVFATRLTDPSISAAVIRQIYEMLKYIQPRLEIFPDDAPWVLKFQQVSDKYRAVVTG